MKYILPRIDDKKLLINSLLEQQKTATNYKKWYEISLKLDELMNHNSWKSSPQSDLYDYNLIFNNLNEMRNARLNKDYKLLLYYIRTKWVRNLGNMGDINLYRHSFTGTKKIIEEYIEECKISLNYLVNDPDVNLDDRYLLGMLIQTRRNIGRTALVLSGGSTFGVFHIGVLATLVECNLLPRIISGSSAGSIVASILCCHTNEEVIEILVTIADKELKLFGSQEARHQSNFKRALGNLSHFIKYGTFFDIKYLKETMIGFLGDLTFREAYNRSGKILNITVSPTSIHESTRLLNYLTAPHCLIWSAVCASCSLPGIFPSTSIYERNPRTGEVREWNNDSSAKYVDGSVDNDLPITRLSEMFNVDHIIAVQVNPHVVPILKVAVSSVGGGELENELANKIKNALNNSYDFLTCEVIHYLQVLNEVDVCKNLSNRLISILSQNYSGDVTILPDYKPMDFLNLFEDPSPEFIVDFILRGARASWPKITVIHNHCGMEFALDNSISLLRGRIITSANSRIAYNKKATKFIRRGKSTIGLVNSPVLSTDKSLSTPNTPEKRKNVARFPTELRRQNSAHVPTKKTVLKKKRNSISVPQEQASTKFSKGKSTTSLSSLSYDFINKNVSAESTLINDTEEDKAPNTTLAKAVDKAAELSDNNEEVEERRKIRKARSSGNIRTHKISSSNDLFSLSFSHNPSNEQLKYQEERIPFHQSNPYLDSAIQQPESIIINDEFKEKAYLPKISAPSSKRNSLIGLNRLKDSNLSRSGNNSINDLNSIIVPQANDTLSRAIRSKDFEKKSSRFSRQTFDTSQVLNSDDDDKFMAFRMQATETGNTEGDEFLGDDEASNPVADEDYDNEVKEYYVSNEQSPKVEDPITNSDEDEEDEEVNDEDNQVVNYENNDENNEDIDPEEAEDIMLNRQNGLYDDV
ncbi:acyl transferase/acyl hydrolase/lysophospholipase [Scheffersomyces coipomensis]|uniref:acyl transferase/acyl hydrolase/lysophospholipase n=1 Tax=Scheffersomyces coipomensis TaxID=1788519 RepID=UPI00315CCABF